MKRPTHGSFQAWALILAACLPMAGCGRSDEPSVQDWITQRRAQAQAAPSTVTEPTAFRAQPYLEGAALDPFNGQKLTQALRQDSAQNSSAALIQPEQARPRQALEAFALDSMTLVGNLMQRGERVALVRVDQRIHTVRIGSYLGQNYGKVVRITEAELVLREFVQDASGVWAQRSASLQLQAGNK
jgi:type IV pilus assembly protein PilP